MELSNRSSLEVRNASVRQSNISDFLGIGRRVNNMVRCPVRRTLHTVKVKSDERYAGTTLGPLRGGLSANDDEAGGRCDKRTNALSRSPCWASLDSSDRKTW